MINKMSETVQVLRNRVVYRLRRSEKDLGPDHGQPPPFCPVEAPGWTNWVSLQGWQGNIIVPLNDDLDARAARALFSTSRPLVRQRACLAM